VRWDEKENYWTNDGFYGISFNEGKQTLSFKTMHFGIFGLSAFRQMTHHFHLSEVGTALVYFFLNEKGENYRFC